MSQPIASLSLDLDNKWSYLKTHGDPGWESFPSYLDVVVPRFLDLFEELRLRVTVFVVGQDAAIPRNGEALAAIAAAGHEIGNHSFHHEPWLHLYSPQEIEEEISAAEEAIDSVTGMAPRGFRGPGYSLSPAVIECLVRRGYQYDASTLPTVVGPLARSYYFFTARLTPDERRKRRQLFGGWSEGLRPITPYWWQLPENADGPMDGRQRLLEIPVTTLPLLRTPIHFSYLLFLRQVSSLAAWSYWRSAMQFCRVTGVEPSLLLHPLDLLGGDEEPDLGFFPAMGMAGGQKRAFVRELLADFARRFRVLSMSEHASALAERKNLPARQLKPVPCQTRGPRTASQSRQPAPALIAEASRQ